MTSLLDALVTGLVYGGVYALLALGLTLQYGVARILNLAYGDFLIAAAVFATLLYQHYQLSPLISLALVAPISFLVHLLVYHLVFVQLERRSGSWRAMEASSILLAFGLSFVVSGAMLAVFGGKLFSYSYLLVPVQILGSVVPANRLLAFVLALLFGGIAYLLLVRTRIGTAIRAIAVDPDGAPLAGIDVRRWAGITFAFGGIICAAGGVLISMFQTFNVPMGVSFTLKALVVVIMGGVGNAVGALVAGLILGVTESFVARYVSPGLTLAAVYGLFVLAVLTMRTGILGRALR
ncbi:MAG: branched-chain amino acid ABC transporter permease [Thermomicrobium sp.]|nr:branched-chain amino acid ABC transporter permease [Thermomicrobium sp.]MDW8007882.1 branched-chain amino acid ABC transporter permease [Thermomicrobium sp.]